MRTIKLAPSILSADFGRLADQLAEVEQAGADLIHVDIMDGHFVPNITIGPLVVSAVKKYTSLPLDVHLMIDRPDDYLINFIDAGADILTFHAEAGIHAHRLAQRIKQAGAEAGIAINPGTPIAAIDELLDDLDMITVMSVNPGFGGQQFIPKALTKIAALRKRIDQLGARALIEVDGGVTPENAAEVVRAGADILVAGAAVFTGGDIKKAIIDFQSVVRAS